MYVNKVVDVPDLHQVGKTAVLNCIWGREAVIPQERIRGTCGNLVNCTSLSVF